MIKNHFTIAIPAYNCEKWIEKNLRSALEQDYDKFDIVYVNDASTDSTAKIADSILEAWFKKPKGGVLSIIHNDENVRALENLISCVNSAQPGSIVVALDGDDWLINKNVLSKLNEVYQDPEVWITAGSYIENIGGRVVRPEMPPNFWNENIRHQHWTLSHLRTFRKELFEKIKIEDMIDRKDGGIYKFTWDRVIMYPMVEMSGPEHFRDIQDILYVYNRSNPIAVDRAHRSDQLRIEAELKQKKPYERLESLV